MRDTNRTKLHQVICFYSMMFHMPYAVAMHKNEHTQQQYSFNTGPGSRCARPSAFVVRECSVEGSMALSNSALGAVINHWFAMMIRHDP